MAEDIGVIRIANESEKEFCTRTAYSASRFWVSAFCMDDGQEGERGITRQALGLRLRAWIKSLDSIMPSLSDWFGVGGKVDTRAIYGRLIDLGDILPLGEGGRYRARAMGLEPITASAALALGFFEPAAERCRNRMVTSGLATYTAGAFEPPETRAPWWETDLRFMPWTNCDDYGTLQYVNPSTQNWTIAKEDSWTQEKPGELPLTLARYNEATTGKANYLVVKNAGGKSLVSRIDRHMAQELFLHLKKAAGEPMRVTVHRKDDHHCEVTLPISMLPPAISATVDALSWPKGSISNGNRIFRTETMDTVGTLLANHDIEAVKPMAARSANVSRQWR